MQATGKKLVLVSRVGVCIWAIIMGCAMSIAQAATINVNWLITIIGALIVSVLRNGLTAMNIDSNYQNLATGVLVILAVAFDQLTRRRSS